LSALDAAFLQQEEAGLENPVESSSSKKQQDELAAYVGLAQVASVLVEKFEMEPEKALEMVKAKVRELKGTSNSDARPPMETYGYLGTPGSRRRRECAVGSEGAVVEN
jgi:hypothetical protein